MEKILLLQEKIESLIKAYTDLKAENRSLLDQIHSLKNELTSAQVQQERLKEKLQFQTLENVGQQLDEEQQKQLKMQIDQVIEMLNKNIDLLKR